MARNPSLDDAEHALTRADQSRDLAEQMGDPISREMMLLIARDCERLAENARVRAQKQKAVKKQHKINKLIRYGQPAVRWELERRHRQCGELRYFPSEHVRG